MREPVALVIRTWLRDQMGEAITRCWPVTTNPSSNYLKITVYGVVEHSNNGDRRIILVRGPININCYDLHAVVRYECADKEVRRRILREEGQETYGKFEYANPAFPDNLYALVRAMLIRRTRSTIPAGILGPRQTRGGDGTDRPGDHNP